MRVRTIVTGTGAHAWAKRNRQGLRLEDRENEAHCRVSAHTREAHDAPRELTCIHKQVARSALVFLERFAGLGHWIVRHAGKQVARMRCGLRALGGPG